MRVTHAFWAVLGILLIAGNAVGELWTPPVLVSGINTSFDEAAPFPTYDGLTLYFSRLGLPAPSGRLYSATRPTSSGPFTSESEWICLNEGGHSVTYSWGSPDNLRLYYYQSGSGMRVVKMSERTSPSDPWMPGSDLDEINIWGDAANPSLSPDELTIVFTGINYSGTVGYDIWMATRTDKDLPFEDLTNLSEINSEPARDYHPRLSSDGLTLYFVSERNDSHGQLFRATRPALDVPFGAPEHLSFFDSPGAWLGYPAISGNGNSLYFAMKETADTSWDIYVSQVVPVPSAVVLGVVGLGFAGCRCRRRAT